MLLLSIPRNDIGTKKCAVTGSGLPYCRTTCLINIRKGKQCECSIGIEKKTNRECAFEVPKNAMNQFQVSNRRGMQEL